MKQTVTLLFLRRGDEILLAMKKRGHGVGKWNGVGGKVESNETIATAAIRECQEEINVTPNETQFAGRLHFRDLADPDFYHDCHVFVAHDWIGEPKESEEMCPQWFHTDDIPYDNMWPADTIWLPHLLQDKLFNGNFILDSDRIHHHDITVTIKEIGRSLV